MTAPFFNYNSNQKAYWQYVFIDGARLMDLAVYPLLSQLNVPIIPVPELQVTMFFSAGKYFNSLEKNGIKAYCHDVVESQSKLSNHQSVREIYINRALQSAVITDLHDLITFFKNFKCITALGSVRNE